MNSSPMREVSSEQARERITAGRCPYCDRGPFRNVALHAYRAHDVDSRRIRQDAGLPWSASICDPDHAALMRDLAVTNDRVSVMAGRQVSGRANEVSPAGQESLRVAHRNAVVAITKVPPSEYPTIMLRLAAGESARAVGATYGVSGSRICQIRRSIKEMAG